MTHSNILHVGYIGKHISKRAPIGCRIASVICQCSAGQCHMSDLSVHQASRHPLPKLEEPMNIDFSLKHKMSVQPYRIPRT